MDPLEKLEQVAAHRAAWAKNAGDVIDVHRKVERYLKPALARCAAFAQSWAALHLKHVYKLPHAREEARASEYIAAVTKAGYGHLVAEAFVVGPAITAQYLQQQILSLDTYCEHGGKFRTDYFLPDKRQGDHVVTIHPHGDYDGMIFNNWDCELILDGKFPVTRGGQHWNDTDGGVCVVLGAGNFSAPIELISKLFVEHKVCVYKPNAVNSAVTGVTVPELFQELIEDGYLAVVDDSVATAQQLIASDLSTEVMLTGAASTFDAIVWGSPRDKAKQQQNKQQNKRACDKPVDAELGNINSVLVVPGEWTDAELRHQAKQVAAVRASVGGHSCPSPQLIVTARDWPQRMQFLEMVREELQGIAPPVCYYPGTQEKYNRFQSAFKQHQYLEHSHNLPVLDNTPNIMFIPDMTSDGGDQELALNFESFCPIIGDYPLDVALDVDSFCAAAADFINNKTWGNLSTTILVDQRTLKYDRIVIERFVHNVDVGAIGVNVWGGFVVFFGGLRWGAPEGLNTPQDVQSGVGRGVGNVFCFDHIKKAVIWTPTVEKAHPKPPKNGQKEALVNQRLVQMNAYPSFFNFCKLLGAAILGA